jgi:hypothetical protein
MTYDSVSQRLWLAERRVSQTQLSWLGTGEPIATEAQRHTALQTSMPEDWFESLAVLPRFDRPTSGILAGIDTKRRLLMADVGERAVLQFTEVHFPSGLPQKVVSGPNHQLYVTATATGGGTTLFVLMQTKE